MGPAAGISFVVLRINRATLRLDRLLLRPLAPPSPLRAPTSTTSCAPARSTFPSTFYPLCAPRHEYRQAIRDSSLYPRPRGGCCHLRVEVQRKTCRANPACKLRGIYTKKSLTGGGEGGGVEDYFFSFFLFFFQRKFQHRARYIITSCRVREMGSAVLRGGGWAAGRIRCRVLSPLEF